MQSHDAPPSAPVSSAPPRRRHGVLGNGMWAAAQQALAIGANAVFGVVFVAVLPVEQYGAYAYGFALAAIGASVMTGGLSGLAVKALVDDEAGARTTVASLLLIREGFALLAYVVLALVSLTSGNSLTVLATLVACVSLFGRAADAPSMWFSARMRTPEVSAIRVLVTLLGIAVRVAGLLTGSHVYFFLAVYAAENLLAGAVIVVRYLRDRDSPGIGRPSRRTTRSLLSQSWPLLISGVANQVNLRADVVLIQSALGVSSVAVYSAAARFSEIAYFLPVVFMNATLPVLLRTRREHGASSGAYRRMLQRSYDQAFWFGVLTAAGIALVGGPVIDLLFGPEYAPSKAVLLIHVLACPFVFMAAVYSKWIIAEGRLWLSVTRHVAGAVVNIGLNLALLPVMGLVGAAVATVASYVLASYVACFFDRASRPAAVQMSLAFIAPLRLLRSGVRKRLGRGGGPRP